MVTEADSILTGRQHINMQTAYQQADMRTDGPTDFPLYCIQADEGGLANRQWTDRGMDASNFNFISDFNSALRCLNNRTLSVYPILVSVKVLSF